MRGVVLFAFDFFDLTFRNEKWLQTVLLRCHFNRTLLPEFNAEHVLAKALARGQHAGVCWIEVRARHPAATSGIATTCVSEPHERSKRRTAACETAETLS